MSTPVFNRTNQHKKGPPPVKRQPKKRQSAKPMQPQAIPTIAGQGTIGKSSFLNTLLQFDDEASSSNTGLRLQVEQDDPDNTLLGVRNLSDTSFTSRNYSNNSNASSSAGELRGIQRQAEEIKRRNKEENQKLLNRHKNNKKKRAKRKPKNYEFEPVVVEAEAGTPLVPLGEAVTPIYETDPSTPLLFYGGKKKKTRKKKTKRRRRGTRKKRKTKTRRRRKKRKSRRRK